MLSCCDIYVHIRFFLGHAEVLVFIFSGYGGKEGGGGGGGGGG